MDFLKELVIIAILVSMVLPSIEKMEQNALNAQEKIQSLEEVIFSGIQ